MCWDFFHLKVALYQKLSWSGVMPCQMSPRLHQIVFTVVVTVVVVTKLTYLNTNFYFHRSSGFRDTGV